MGQPNFNSSMFVMSMFKSASPYLHCISITSCTISPTFFLNLYLLSCVLQWIYPFLNHQFLFISLHFSSFLFFSLLLSSFLQFSLLLFSSLLFSSLLFSSLLFSSLLFYSAIFFHSTLSNHTTHYNFNCLQLYLILFSQDAFPLSSKLPLCTTNIRGTWVRSMNVIIVDIRLLLTEQICSVTESRRIYTTAPYTTLQYTTLHYTT